ncbi:shikimate kinase [Anaerovorax sp. IOR16]|uniref:shikimate kinase n=1 Tax=Anaerovorax sp. IOR16 TaxID=2773458 RepID=UPI0019D0293C|nr:shikimate kinase [Anaerovorax sp. IOR16]
MTEQKSKEIRSREDVRKRIDTIDDALMELLTKRMSISLEMAEAKKQKGLPLFDAARENEILEKISNFSKEFNPKNAMQIHSATEKVYAQIMTQSRRIQSNILLPNVIYLIGYMGSGKTTVGKELSQVTGFSFIDMDTKIQLSEHNSIRTIFNEKGEPYFREKETALLETLSHKKEIIVSCGGGIVLNENNRKLLKDSGGCIFLDGFPRDMFERIKADPNRPNAYFETENEEQRLTQFNRRYQKRKDFYLEAANRTIFIDKETPEQIAKGITFLLSNE